MIRRAAWFHRRPVELVGLLALAMLASVVPALHPSSASAAGGAGMVTSYTDPNIINPVFITPGPDGALWFLNEPVGQSCPPSCDSIGRITTSGAVSNFTVSGGSAVIDTLVEGPDGALWFTFSIAGQNCTPRCGSIGRITTSGVISTYDDPSINLPRGIAPGPDGALWFTNYVGPSIGRITTSGAITHYALPSGFSPTSITAGPDRAMWFTGVSFIGRIDQAGTVTTYPNGGIDAESITAGPDGALWFKTRHSLNRMTTTGALTSHPLRTGNITAGPDGALWFSLPSANHSVGRITPSGAVTTYSDPAITGGWITSGSDGGIWLTNELDSSILRVSTDHSVVPSPMLAAAGAALTLTGAGYVAGETVTVKYETGLQAPQPTAIALCTTTVASDGTFTCSSTTPGTGSGGTGVHVIKAKGQTSGTVAKTVFLRFAA